MEPLGDTPDVATPHVTTPPDDATEWTDEQWIEWLDATDADSIDDSPVTPRRRSRTGSALGNAMLGLADALYGRQRREVAIVQEAPGEPEDDRPIELHLDRDDPSNSTVTIRHQGDATTDPPPHSEPSS